MFECIRSVLYASHASEIIVFSIQQSRNESIYASDGRELLIQITLVTTLCSHRQAVSTLYYIPGIILFIYLFI